MWLPAIYLTSNCCNGSLPDPTATMPSDSYQGFSCPNPLCDSTPAFPDYDAVCAHLSDPDTFCFHWAVDFVDRMTQSMVGNQNEYNGTRSRN